MLRPGDPRQPAQSSPKVLFPQTSGRRIGAKNEALDDEGRASEVIGLNGAPHLALRLAVHSPPKPIRVPYQLHFTLEWRRQGKWLPGGGMGAFVARGQSEGRAVSGSLDCKGRNEPAVCRPSHQLEADRVANRWDSVLPLLLGRERRQGTGKGGHALEKPVFPDRLPGLVRERGQCKLQVLSRDYARPARDHDEPICDPRSRHCLRTLA